MNITLEIPSLDKINEVARQFIRNIGDATVFAFYGKMGAGKTSLIKELCSELGTKDIVNSPTFSIVNIYDTESEKIYHFDCYRLNSITEALDLGIEDYFYSNHYCFIEWPENIETILPNDIIKITIEHSIDNTRKVTVC
jgi:tRNA threonylcarbamoyladenosine biosynthesis protein TsaE